MAQRFSFPEYQRSLAAQCERNSETLETSDGDEITLDEHQQRAMANAAGALKSGKKSFSIVHPCGAGKTILEAALVKASQEAKANLSPTERSERKDIILTVERSMMDGIRDQIEKIIGRDVGIWGDGQKELKPNVIVASIQALQYHKDNIGKEFDPAKVSLVIGDEADKYLTENRVEVIEQFRRAQRVGCTATPQWPDGRHISTVWGEIIHKMTLKQGMEKGVNVRSRFYMYKADVDGDEIRREGQDYNKRALGKAMKSAQIENAISRIYAKLDRRERKNFPTLIYVPTLQILGEVTKRMQREFGHNGLVVKSWDGDTSGGRLEDEKREFREGQIDILVLCEMGGRSLDLPRARFLIDASPTLSLNKLEQRHGRVLRTIRQGSIEAESGFRKNSSLIVQILPRSTKFRPVTLLDVLKIPPKDYEPGKLLGRADGSGEGGHGDLDEVKRILKRFKSKALTSSVELMETSDLSDILTLDDLPKLADDGFAYFDD